ncbi:MAG: GTP-binding protein [Gemmatimonadales bacterium]
MAHINHTTREITCKLVYDGPVRAGKTSNLLYLRGRVRVDRRGAGCGTDSDFLTLDLGAVGGFAVRFQIVAVPGGMASRSTRQLILHGADGVIFVADSQARRMDENLAVLRELEARLDQAVPLVVQYNKQDLPPGLILTSADLAAVLGTQSSPGVPADARHGGGVVETFERLSALVLSRLA